MFVYSVKSNTLKFAGVILLAVAAVITLIIAIPGNTEAAVTVGAIFQDTDTKNYENIKTEDDAKEFLEQFGWETGEAPEEVIEFTVPADFDKVMNAYNELQKTQGLELSEYKGKDVTRYTFEIKNYPDYDGKVLGNIIVYKERVIAGDICSADINGFIVGFEK